VALKRINQSPKITDEVVFDLPTPDADGCFNSAEYQARGGPYKVDKVVIYHVEIDQNAPNAEEYEKNLYESEKWTAYEAARAAACDSPTDDNLFALTQAQEALVVSAKQENIYYRSAEVVAKFGTSEDPAWLSSDTDNAFIIHIDEDADGNPQYGHYELHWEPKGVREGDYFICWTWTPNPAGDSLTAHTHFTLFGDTQLTTSIPSHYTPEGKYETLLDRYLPEVYKTSLSDSDIAPRVFHELNAAIAKGFIFLEDMANQMVDLQDANTIHESLIPYLSNLFNLRLKSDDPTLWRAQVKRAIPLFKKKGTLSALQEAFNLAGMNLTKFTKLWQVISLYTWQEAFDIEDEDELTFVLDKNAVLPIDVSNCEVYYRPADSDSWTQLTTDYLVFDTDQGETTITWIGHELSYNPIVLEEGDTIRVIYPHTAVPDSAAQTIEDYVRELPLADQRDHRDQDCPLKNWNVRVIEEDDPMFDVVIPTRHPYHDPLIYGWVRTEFPYSENIYNMEEYNGSTRESCNPCDIDCQFLDPCLYCQSSKFIVDVEVERLSNDRILETQEILQEFTPFHAVTHAINFTGAVNEYIALPEETVEALVHINTDEITVAGGAQMIFMRTMNLAKEIDRNDLALKTTVATQTGGTAYNDEIVLFSPDIKLEGIGMNHQSPDSPPGVMWNNYLEVLAPSANSGTYRLGEPDKHNATVTKISGSIGESPLDTQEFTFRLSNEIYELGSVDVLVEFCLTDATVDFEEINVKSTRDVNDNPHHIDAGSAWKVKIPAYSATPYTVKEIQADGSLLLEDSTPGTLPTSVQTGMPYTLYDGDDNIKATSSAGAWEKTGRGVVDLTGDSTMTDVRDVFRTGSGTGRDYIDVGGTQYAVSGYVYDETHYLYLANYDVAAVGGTTITGYRRLVDGARGYFNYRGLKLKTGTTDFESDLEINNGANPPAEMLENDSFKENFLILIDSEYYAVSEWDAETITLSGPYRSWKTLTPGGGTSVTYSILQYEKVEADIDERPHLLVPVPGHYFGKIEATNTIWEQDKLDRSDNEVIEISIEEAPATPLMAHMLNNKGSGVEESQGQEEAISYAIEWAPEGEK